MSHFWGLKIVKVRKSSYWSTFFKKKILFPHQWFFLFWIKKWPRVFTDLQKQTISGRKSFKAQKSSFWWWFFKNKFLFANKCFFLFWWKQFLVQNFCFHHFSKNTFLRSEIFWKAENQLFDEPFFQKKFYSLVLMKANYVQNSCFHRFSKNNFGRKSSFWWLFKKKWF